RTGAAFLPFAVRCGRPEPQPQGGRRQRPPQGRSLLQGAGAGAAPGHAPRRYRTAFDQGGIVSAVGLIDAGGANLGSVRYALERLGVAVRMVREPSALEGVQRVI